MATSELSPSIYHRTLGRHASALGRLAIASGIGLAVLAVTWPLMLWPLPALVAWDVACLVIVTVKLHLILTADAANTMAHAQMDDETRTTARLIVSWVAVASLLGVGWALHTAKARVGGTTAALLTFAALTVLLSWTVVNTTFTLHYAHLYYQEPAGDIDFADDPPPDYRDFAYLAFTIGMTYQVSDTALKTKAMRRTALWHALVSYVFGVVIVATVVNIVASYV